MCLYLKFCELSFSSSLDAYEVRLDFAVMDIKMLKMSWYTVAEHLEMRILPNCSSIS